MGSQLLSNVELNFKIVLENPPAGIDFGLQKGGGTNYQTVQKQRSVDRHLEFTFSLRLKKASDGSPDFLGSFSNGPTGQRFVYIDIGAAAGQVGSVWSRRLKIPLKGIDDSMVKKVLEDPNKKFEARVAGRGKDGTPSCGTIKPFSGWKVVA